MAEVQHDPEIDLPDAADQIAELKRDLADPRPLLLIYECGCQAPVDFPDRCPVQAAPVRNMARPRCSED